MQICIMKEVVWLMSDDPDSLPLFSAYFSSKAKNYIFVLFYTVVWAISYAAHKSIRYSGTVKTSSMIVGFAIGLFLVLLHMFLNINTYQLVINAKTWDFTIVNSPVNYRVVLKNTLFKMPKRYFVLMAKENYLSYKKSGDIVDMDIYEYYTKIVNQTKTDMEIWKKLKDSSFVDRRAETMIANTAGKFLLVLLSMAVITAKVDISLFYGLLPWFIVSATFTIGAVMVYIINPFLTGAINEIALKQKLFLTGLSFGIMTIFNVLFR